MKIYLASDHAGYAIKEKVKALLKIGSHEVLDQGPNDETRVNYPDFAANVCRKIQVDQEARGILICGSGIGMSIAANRFSNIRAALCRTLEEAELSREHNDANILCLGARTTDESLIFEIVKKWLESSFAGGRHSDRIALFNDLGENVKND